MTKLEKSYTRIFRYSRVYAEDFLWKQ